MIVRESKMSQDVYWNEPIRTRDDFGDYIGHVFYDAKTRMGPWALMSPRNWAIYSYCKLGMGLGQKYVKQPSGRYLKVEG